MLTTALKLKTILAEEWQVSTGECWKSDFKRERFAVFRIANDDVVSTK